MTETRDGSPVLEHDIQKARETAVNDLQEDQGADAYRSTSAASPSYSSDDASPGDDVLSLSPCVWWRELNAHVRALEYEFSFSGLQFMIWLTVTRNR